MNDKTNAKNVRWDLIEKAKKEIGNIYGEVKVVGVSNIRSKAGQILHEAVCLRCGSPFIFIVNIHMLRSGNTKSCGCLRIDVGKERYTTWNKNRSKKNEQTTD